MSEWSIVKVEHPAPGLDYIIGENADGHVQMALTNASLGITASVKITTPEWQGLPDDKTAFVGLLLTEVLEALDLALHPTEKVE
jgi:hypothetical protein